MPNAHDIAQTKQRVKVGMIGLAAVILLIGLASAIFSAVRQDGAVTAVGAPKADVVANLIVANDTGVAATNEPLVDLGVSPGATSVTANSATPATPAVP
ncbi:hypothetical protein [Sphingomonas sp. Leaf17]|uniref:hypothetical protein n=1 Tax=Sphingomonas sp. Leaf17 TaxID=1735683 RepID=UPI001F408A9F|nr:hypothetical protein [Sphingomonas sp. Leaf17]